MVMFVVNTHGATLVAKVGFVQIMTKIAKELEHKVKYSGVSKLTEVEDFLMNEDFAIGSCACKTLCPDIADFGWNKDRANGNWRVQMKVALKGEDEQLQITCQDFVESILNNRIEELFVFWMARVKEDVVPDELTPELVDILERLPVPPVYFWEGSYHYDKTIRNVMLNDDDKNEIANFLLEIQAYKGLQAKFKEDLVRIVGGFYKIEVPQQMKDELKEAVKEEHGWNTVDGDDSSTVESREVHEEDMGASEATSSASKKSSAKPKKVFKPKKFS